MWVLLGSVIVTYYSFYLFSVFFNGKMAIYVIFLIKNVDMGEMLKACGVSLFAWIEFG